MTAPAAEKEPGKPRTKPRTSVKEYAQTILWVAANLEKAGLSKIDCPTPLHYTLWAWATRDETNKEKFLDKHLPRVLQYIDKVDRKRQERQQMAVEDVEQVKKLRQRLASFLKGRVQVFCESCWRQLEGTDGAKAVKVVHK
ncbi:MAG: hypothetical protein ACYTAO_17785 [Planctomycetota bacterium]|jgi:hypothetical protein